MEYIECARTILPTMNRLSLEVNNQYYCIFVMNGNELINKWGVILCVHTTGTTILLSVFTNYARPQEVMQLITLRLQEDCDIVDVGSVTFTDTPPAPPKKEKTKKKTGGKTKGTAKTQKL